MWWKETEMRMEMEMGGSVLGEEARGGDIQLLFPAQGGTWVAYCTWCDVGLIRGGAYCTGVLYRDARDDLSSSHPLEPSTLRQYFSEVLGSISGCFESDGSLTI